MENREKEKKRCSLDKTLFVWYNMHVQEEIYIDYFIAFDEFLHLNFHI